MGETYYDVLGIDPDATPDEIRSAYRDRVLETHPDHNDEPDAAAQFRRVSRAESVLTDGMERARYDRLGHESYVRLAQHSTAGDTSETTSDDQSPSTDTGQTTDRTSDRSQTTNRCGQATGQTQHTAEQRRHDRSARTETDASTGRSRSRGHHARQRSKRHRQTSSKRASGSWSFDANRDRSSTGSGQSNQQRSTAETNTASETGFSYDVHSWDDEIELTPNSHRLDQPTIVGLGAVTALYPLLVYASLTPLFSAVTNAIVAACTLVLIGYMLTTPRVAVVSFGGWSILLPLVLSAGPFDPVSLYGLLAIAFCWIPFGFAIGVWWALRP